MKARYDDGSIKHAILTLNIPRLDAKSTTNTGLLDVVLTRTPEVVLQSLTANDILNVGVNLSVDVNLSRGDGEWLLYASERDRTRPLWREELIHTRDNLAVPIELRLPLNTTPFPLTIKGSVYTNGRSEQVFSRVINITPQGTTARLDLSAILAGTLVDRVWITGTPAGTFIPTAIDLASGNKASIPTINVSNLLAESIANRSFSTWMSGPSVVEVRVEQVLDTSLKARFDIRYYRDGTIRTNVIMLNETPTYSTGNRNIAYDIVAKQGNFSKVAVCWNQPHSEFQLE